MPCFLFVQASPYELSFLNCGNGAWNVFFFTPRIFLSFTFQSFGWTTMAVTLNVSHFEGITMAPPDPILGVSEAFKSDTNDLKLNLGVGAYRTEELQCYVLNVVKKAENLMPERGENKVYLPIEGLAAFSNVTAQLLFGADNPVIQQGKVATVQGNHKNIFNDARVPWSKYRYYDPKTVGLGFNGMIEDIQFILNKYDSVNFAIFLLFIIIVVVAAAAAAAAAAAVVVVIVIISIQDTYDLWQMLIVLMNKGLDGDGGSSRRIFFLLHGCAHNPTGIDPTLGQWEKIADVIQEKNHIPFFDVAYQGFASGSLDEDAASVRLFAERGMELLVAQSYSKNLGLYAERIGAINVVCSSLDAATRVKSQLKRIAQPMYSNPPVHGARIVANIVGVQALFKEWKDEMELVAGQIKGVRQKLFNSLSAKDKSGKDWSFILKQIGMFSFTGLNKAQNGGREILATLVSPFYVQTPLNVVVYPIQLAGYIWLAGLSLAQCEYLADAIIDSYHNVS
ncbi:Aminotransferase, class I/classII [Dillenia turbinata]|uniref:Aspartate aminotransferase n=1 Tax=Dillenia turbinata TaxID=194707 RepID=A0AAN8UJY2_9MAGN